ncbi:hypothetical protein IFM89_018332 [Coptis chinensis]|uniref:Uncharacterized protein n=1 Tax=Coptis chinensis TaxID=261450 RepID=A0A835M9D7_9MAGN|nr:hypothetical protein IFM89_018332 [Coptis chinensis]
MKKYTHEVYLANLRLKGVGTDVLITAYEPIVISKSTRTVGAGLAIPAMQSRCMQMADVFKLAVSSFKVQDWDLFAMFQNPRLPVEPPSRCSCNAGKWLPGAVLNSAGNCLSLNSKRSLDDIVIKWCDERVADLPVNNVTLKELRKEVWLVSYALQTLGLDKGSAIAIDMPMNVTVVIIYLAIVLAGYVVVSIADSFASSEISMRLRISKAKAIFTQELDELCGVALGFIVSEDITNTWRQDKNKAKYALQQLVCTNKAFDDQSYNSVVQEHDEEGKVGISLSLTLLQVARKALKTNITTLAPLVLPYTEQLKYGWSIICREIWASPNTKDVCVPNFKKAFDHFWIHTGGRAVIDAVEDSLSLSNEDGEASRMALYRFGNTSSS